MAPVASTDLSQEVFSSSGLLSKWAIILGRPWAHRGSLKLGFRPSSTRYCFPVEGGGIPNQAPPATSNSGIPNQAPPATSNSAQMSGRQCTLQVEPRSCLLKTVCCLGFLVRVMASMVCNDLRTFILFNFQFFLNLPMALDDRDAFRRPYQWFEISRFAIHSGMLGGKSCAVWRRGS